MIILVILHFLCFMSYINVFRKLVNQQGITFNSPLTSVSVEEISDHLFHAYCLNYFSRAEGVLKATENVEICGVYCPSFNFVLC